MYSSADEICKACRLAGHLTGHKDRAQYVPDVYARNQDEGVKAFFKENGFIAYSRLKARITYLRSS